MVVNSRCVQLGLALERTDLCVRALSQDSVLKVFFDLQLTTMLVQMAKVGLAS